MRSPREGDRSAVGTEHAADRVEQRRLAGAVGADDGEDVALHHVEAHVADGKQAAKALAHPGDGQKRAHSRFSKPSLRASQGHTPSGMSAITSNRQKP